MFFERYKHWSGVEQPARVSMLVNIRLGRRLMALTNALAFIAEKLIPAIKRFIEFVNY